MNWFRWHHGTATDPKWRVIAGRANETQCNATKHTVRISDVLSVWAVMLESASTNEIERGTVTGWDHEDVGAALDLPTETVERIWNAMQGKVIVGQRLTAWDKRQPKREDHSTERVQRYRQRVTHETISNAVKRAVTPEERRGDKKRREKKLLTTSASAAPAPSAAEGSGKDSTPPEVPTISTNPSFVSLLGDDWKEITGGLPSWGKLGAALEPVVKTYGIDRVRPAWRKFCNSTNRKYGPMHFKEHFGDYEPKIVSGLDEATILEALGIRQ